MTEDELLFLSNNVKKLEEVRNKLKSLDVTVTCQNYRFKEQPTDDLLFITLDKALVAYEELNRPLIVTDTAFYIAGYEEEENFPGVAIKSKLLEPLGIAGLLEKMKDVKNRNCLLKECLAYYDGENMKVFESKQRGTLAKEEHINKELGEYTKLFGVFIPEGTTKTVNEMTKEEREALGEFNPNVFSLFSTWYKKERSKCLVKKI